MISAVLLIAFTVAVAGIVSTWLPGFFGGVTGNVENTTTSQTECAGVYLDVFRVTDTTILVRNPSSKQITNLVILDNTGTSYTPDKTTLTAGDIARVTSGWSAAGKTEVIANGLCQGEVAVTGSCSQGDACWKA